MEKLASVIAYMRARPALVILTACAFTFFFGVIYFALAMIFSIETRNMAALAAFVGSACITAAIVKRNLGDV